MTSDYSLKKVISLRKICIIIISTLLIFCSVIKNSNAQVDSIVPVKRSHVNNILKLNIAGLVFGSISVQDEIYFNGKISGAVTLNYSIPSMFLPGKLFPSPSDRVEFNNMTVSGLSITPEVRFYVKKAAPKGFYLAPYVRYSRYSFDDIRITYDSDDSLKTEKTAILSGKYKQFAGGVMIGSQSKMGSHWVLDWWILGVALGSINVNFDAYGNFSQKNQDDIKSELKNVSGGFDVSGVTSSRIAVRYSPSFSYRMGFAIGYIF